MRILILTDGIFPFVIGGMQKHSHYLVRYLHDRGHEVTVAHCVHAGPVPDQKAVDHALGYSGGEGPESICIRFPSTNKLPGHYIKESYIYSRLLFSQLESRLPSFDFIYAKGFSAWYLLERKSRGQILPPVGVKFHGYEMFQPPASFGAWLQQLLLRGAVRWNNRHADFVFSYGGKITGLIRSLGVPEQKIIEIPSGIEAKWCRDHVDTREGEIRLLFVGRYERRKGIPELHEAVRILGQKGYRIEFVGPIPPGRRLQLPNCHYHGQVADTSRMKSIMDECDVLVVPSHSEGMPNVILEGMARGLGILATDVGAVRSLVGSDNGWIIESLKPPSLAKDLERVVCSPRSEIEEKKSASLRKVLASFTWEAVSAQVEQAIRERLR